MVETDKFVFLHMPKCGGTFIRKTLRTIHDKYSAYLHRKINGLITILNNSPKIAYFRKYGIVNKFISFLLKSHWVYILHQPTKWHDGRSKILKHSQQKLILLSTRNPFALRLSYYFYSQLYLPSEKRTVPYNLHLPKKTFAETISLCLTAGPDTPLENSKGMGDVATMAINTLALKPDEIFALEEAELIQFFQRGKHKEWLENTFVIHQENLRQELYNFLILQGYPEEAAKVALHIAKENVSLSSKKDYKSFFTHELKQHFYDLNWPFFEIFPEYKSELSGIKTKL